MSDIEVLERRFATIGAHLRAVDGPWRGAPRIDVDDRSGFSLEFSGVGAEADAEVVCIDPVDRHLVLLVRAEAAKSKFLCGHDERHWFVAAIPESARGVTSVESAKAALQPPIVASLAGRVPRKRRFDRRNEAYLRQGEWFFVPVANLRAEPWQIRRNEPLARAGGTPHVLREAVRRGGQPVYVGSRGRVVTPAAFAKLDERQRRGLTLMHRDPELYARGSVRHPDHATVMLRGWHRVVMNTEQGAKAMRHVIFVD
jgi:hypothetical protein